MRLIGLAMAALLLTACGSGGESGSAAQPSEAPAKTWTASGSLTLPATATDYLGAGEEGEECFGFQGFEDIEQGAQVVVRDDAGKTVSIGQLAPGRIHGNRCVLDFDVSDIDSDGKLFSVEVAHRGQTQFKRADADHLDLTAAG